MKTLLTGIRASGDIHLGNYLGAIRPAIERQEKFETFLFVADLHGLTTSPKKEELKQNVRSIAAAWLASGLDPKKTTLWVQSDVPEVLELAYVLSCVTSLGLLERAHSYKDALQKQKIVKAGLFYYPVLMAADILLYDSDLVPVGRDQAQHLEMTRDMATFFNETYQEIFRLPEALISEEIATVPGTDGRKMSKSYDNGIDLFAEESVLKKQVMSIKTDSRGLEEPKVAEDCLVYQLYKLLAKDNESKEMKSKLEAGGYGYGDAKKQLFALLIDGYKPLRAEYKRWMNHESELQKVLSDGASRAQIKAKKMMSRVREAIGL